MDNIQKIEGTKIQRNEVIIITFEQSVSLIELFSESLFIFLLNITIVTGIKIVRI